MRFAARTAALAAAATLAAGAANALTIGFSLMLSGDANVPTFALTNTSTRAAIESFDFTIGDVTRNFDAVTLLEAPAGGTSALLFGSATQGGSSATGGRTDNFTIGFTGFAPGLTSRFTTDVDRDDVNSLENYRVRFFNNGEAPNSVITVLYDTGSILTLALPDQTTQLTSFTFAQSVEVAPIPLPAGLSLLGGALFGLVVASRRRRRRG